jgi:hypothetical protein
MVVMLELDSLWPDRRRASDRVCAGMSHDRVCA